MRNFSCRAGSFSIHFWLGLFLFLPTSLLVADAAIAPPPGGTALFPQNAESTFDLSNPDFGEKALVPAQGVPFSQAVELRTRKTPPYIWNFQLSQKVPTLIHQGDVLWLSLWMRSTEAGDETQEGLSQLCLEKSFTPFDKLGVFDLYAGKAWQQFAFTCVADHDYGPGETQVCLRGGYAPQVIQLGGFQMLDYGHSVKPDDLPHSPITYPGMEADASWRKAAAERIERYRKGDLKVMVKNASGHAVAGATVTIEQQRHAFGFGSCVTAALIEGTGPDNDRYREVIKANFSKVVFENDLKWNSWIDSAAESHRTTLAALQWLQEQGIEVRGHNLVWPSWGNTPSFLGALKTDPNALEQKIEDHLRDEVGTTKGQLTEWDVVNEPYTNHEILDLLPSQTMAHWFGLVHQVDPRPVLFLNDFAGLTERGDNTTHKDAFEKTLRTLKDEGAPIGGLGLQAHFEQELTGPEQIVKELDRWATLGLDIQITEFDLNFNDEKVQGQYTRDFMTAVFSHPAVSALLTWGFWEGSDWKPQAALYRKDWSLKPNGEAWNDLVLKEWHTRLTATSDASGTVATRGFLGSYQITVTYQGKSKTWPLTLTKEGAVLSATLPTD